MQLSYTVFLSALLGGGAFAANSKLNQYASISDWYITSRYIVDYILIDL
jgi:hypothetical protein